MTKGGQFNPNAQLGFSNNMVTHRELEHERRERLRTAGICITCGREPVTTGRKGQLILKCRACDDAHREQTRASKQRRKRKDALAAMRKEERDGA